MKNFTLGVLFVSLLFVAAKPVADDNTYESTTVVIRFHTNKTEYIYGEKIYLDIILENVSNKEVMINDIFNKDIANYISINIFGINNSPVEKIEKEHFSCPSLIEKKKIIKPREILTCSLGDITDDNCFDYYKFDKGCYIITGELLGLFHYPWLNKKTYPDVEAKEYIKNIYLKSKIEVIPFRFIVKGISGVTHIRPLSNAKKP